MGGGTYLLLTSCYIKSNIPSKQVTYISLFSLLKSLGAWPFLVGGVICLVNSVNERDLSLLNNVVNDFHWQRFLEGHGIIKFPEE